MKSLIVKIISAIGKAIKYISGIPFASWAIKKAIEYFITRNEGAIVTYVTKYIKKSVYLEDMIVDKIEAKDKLLGETIRKSLIDYHEASIKSLKE